ncbi:hypothetical protein BD408DRAFT_76061 [Parasitella parasitica]|nr:hypothetical protein BD408DRAFT_76061 [Parasitella parasitica]
MSNLCTLSYFKIKKELNCIYCCFYTFLLHPVTDYQCLWTFGRHRLLKRCTESFLAGVMLWAWISFNTFSPFHCALNF